MAITYFSANKIIDRNFGSVAYTPPGTMYFGLSTTAIAIDGTGATEPSGGSYARVALVNDKTNWGTASNGILTNSAAVTFAESTASWGTITYVFISDALTSGNIWFFDVLTPSRAVASATTVLFAIGAITVQMNNS